MASITVLLRTQVRKFVAGSPDGEDEPWLAVILDLLSQPFDECVDAALRDVRVVAPDALHQRFPAEDDAAVRREQVEQVELIGGEVDFASIESRLAARRIDRQRPGDDRGGLATASSTR